MILYEYQCRECAVVFDAFSRYKDRETTHKCPNCSGEGIYKVSPPFLKAYLDSDKWVKNRESHMKKERKNMDSHGTYDQLNEAMI